jgi:signal transduction histidine kinase
LDNKTLEQAVREVVENTRQSGVGVEWMLKGESRRLPPPVELTLFRVAQEGLTNVQKHSRATRAVVSLDYRKPGWVQLTISDNGCGASEGQTTGFGLVGLRERAQLAGGSLRTRTAPNAGFELEVEVPG